MILLKYNKITNIALTHRPIRGWQQAKDQESRNLFQCCEAL